MALRMHVDETAVDEHLVRQLIVSQMPDFAEMALAIVEPWGTDNALWRLGDDLVVRLPRIGWAQGQVQKEALWLPMLGPQLPIAVPVPVAVGAPGLGYPYQWAVHRWIGGVGATLNLMGNPETFAKDLAEFVRALKQVSIEGAPVAHNRARPLNDYDASTRAAIASASRMIDADAATAIWDAAVAADPYRGAPVWVHGDLEGNCLLRDGRLGGIVDWGSACAGDPAVDVQVVWSPLFTAQSRAVFFAALGVDEDTILRSRGAAINQACAALPYYLDTYPLIVERSWHKLAALGVRARSPSRHSGRS